MLSLEDITADIAAFADEANDVIIEPNGDLLFRRLGQDITCKVTQRPDGMLLIDDGSGSLPYRDFLARKVAHLDAFAHKLLASRPPDSSFVEGSAELESISSRNRTSPVLTILQEQCDEPSPFASRVVFITADAGYGKTALLKQFQYSVANRFLKGQSPYVFWHVDLQGRQLVRLSEALMGDLGDLRVAGLFMPSVLALIRHRLLILAIDGFDELAAEQGTTNALGALRVLLDQMNGRGVIVAASRRTFFNSENYARRTSLIFPTATATFSEFNEIRLRAWTKSEVLEYFRKVRINGKSVNDPESTYGAILSQLGGDPKHPMLTTPFLISHVVKGMLLYEASPAEFIKGMTDPTQGVPAVIQAFVKREVSDKWKSKDTGEPYLTVEQHLELLTSVADEMWNSQVDRLPVDVIEALAAMLLDQWKIDVDRRRQVHEMVRMHVLLPRPSDAREDLRGFEHAEFKNYFTARILSSLIAELSAEPSRNRIARFLSLGQLPDSVARFASSVLSAKQLTADAIAQLCDIAKREWRPTYLQLNLGTVIPWMLDRVQFGQAITIDGKLVFASVVFQNTVLSNVVFHGCQFVQTTLCDVTWKDVTLRECSLNEVAFDRDSKYSNVVLDSCGIESITLTVEGKEVERAYSRSRVLQILKQVGVILKEGGAVAAAPAESRSDANKLVSRLLRAFRQGNAISEGRVKLKFPSDRVHVVLAEIIPLMVRHKLLAIEPWHGKGHQDIWVLKRGVDEILRADGGEGDPDLQRFWTAINSMD
jgi:hypothetical protein